jgi:hypothetical protein
VNATETLKDETYVLETYLEAKDFASADELVSTLDVEDVDNIDLLVAPIDLTWKYADLMPSRGKLVDRVFDRVYRLKGGNFVRELSAGWY